MSNTYHHIYQRVNYPEEGGYRMEADRLPHWIHLTVGIEGDSKVLRAHSSIHVNNAVKVGPEYSLGFSDSDIIKDQSGNIFSMFIK